MRASDERLASSSPSRGRKLLHRIIPMPRLAAGLDEPRQMAMFDGTHIDQCVLANDLLGTEHRHNPSRRRAPRLRSGALAPDAC